MVGGNVIRAGAIGGRPPVTRISREARGASTDAAEILMRAQERAGELVVQAENAKAAIFAESAERGYAEGLEQWNELLADGWKRREEYLCRNELELVKLAVAVAAQVVADAAQASPDAVLCMVRRALQSMAGANKIMLKVNPSEEEWVRQKLSGIEALKVAEIVIAGNDAVEVGGCIAESETAIVDARLSTQLAALEKVLLRRANASHG